jgi:hypothetical protein
MYGARPCLRIAKQRMEARISASVSVGRFRCLVFISCSSHGYTNARVSLLLPVNNNLIVGRAASETHVWLYPKDTIQHRDGARIIARSDKERASAG